MWMGQWSSTLAKSFWFQCSAASLNAVEADRGLQSLPAPPPRSTPSSSRKSTPRSSRQPQSLGRPRRPASIVSVGCHESGIFSGASFSRGPSQAWEPCPGNSGLWAAPGTLLALPGGPVRERLISLPPAVQKILPTTSDRFGCWAGGQKSRLKAAPPHLVQECPLQTPAAAPPPQPPKTRGPHLSWPLQCWPARWGRLALHRAGICCLRLPCSWAPGSDPWTHSSSHSPRPRTGQQSVGGGAQDPRICLLGVGGSSSSVSLDSPAPSAWTLQPPQVRVLSGSVLGGGIAQF